MSIIPRKLKPCIACKKEKFLFGHGMCKVCYDRNRNTGFLTRTSQYKGKNTSPAKKSAVKRPVIKTTGRKAFYMEIWEERPHISEISGLRLLPVGHIKWHWQFSHILPHSIYKHMEFDKRNITTCLPEEHELWENHKSKIFDEQGNVLLPKWEKVVKLSESLKKEYHERFSNQNKKQ